MDGQGQGKSDKGSHLGGGAVTKELLGEIDVTKLARERRQKAKENVEPTAEWGRPPPKPEHQSKQSNTSMRAALDRRCVKALAPEVARRLQAAREEWGTVRQRLRLARPPPAEEPAPEPPQHKEAKVTPRRSEPKPEREPAPKAPHEAMPGCQGQDEEKDPDRARAVELFQSFLERGRNAENWRKNDLRLINHIVVPMLFGDASIDWARPVLALDELEELVRSFPEKLALLPRHKAASVLPDRHTFGVSGGNDPSKEAGRPPAMPGTRSPLSAEGAGGAGLRSRAGTGDSGKRCSERRSPQSDSTRTTRSASPSRAVATHQEAIRARREALEQARQESLQKALSKKDGGGQNRQDEIASLEAQIMGGSCSSYAVAGLKRRLQTLKAAALREERAAAARAAAAVVCDGPSGGYYADNAGYGPQRSDSLSRPSSGGLEGPEDG
ncbi:unnamed protein product [Symbiodinium microadriaticum]|nr:unnamed protein product [Symbiodinium microadriaticum]